MRFKFQSVCAVAVFVFSCVFSYGSEVKRPEISVPRTDKPPVIDGDLSDACWENAAVLENFYLLRAGGDTTEKAKAYLLHDDEWLYIAVEIELPNMEAFEVVDLLPDGPIHRIDCVEFFLDPSPDGETYIHYLLGISNVRGERLCTGTGSSTGSGRSRDTTWNVPWRSGTRITDAGWSAEAALPLAVIAEYGGIENLTMNIGVNRILTTLNEFGVVVSARREISSWAPVNRGFHDPASFGIVKGMENVEPKMPRLVSARSVRTSSYMVDDDGGFYYEVTGGVNRYAGTGGQVRVMVEDKPGVGTGETVYQDIELVDETTPFSLTVPVTILSDRTADLTLRDPDTAEVLQVVALRDMAGLSLMRSYARYSYYTDERQAEIVCELGLPEPELKRMRLVVNDADGKQLARENNLSPETFVTVPISRMFRKLPDGVHTWTIELQRENGDVVVAQDVEVVKREPRPGAEWKIDHAEGCLLKNGKPFFPFGMMASMPETGEGLEVMSKDLADMGFNSVVRWGRVDDPENLKDLYKMAEKHDFYIAERPHTWRWVPGREADKWHDTIERIMHHPRLQSWYLWDEPAKTLEMAALLKQINDSVNEADGYHPTQVLYIPPFPHQPEFSECSDIYGVDPYWTPGGGVGGHNPNSVGRVTWQTRRRADRDLKITSITPCAELWSGTRMRILEENEQRAQTYLSLIQGAQGLLYFVYPFRHQSTYDTFKRLGEEMKILGPACVAGHVPQNVTYTPEDLDQANNIYTDVQVALKRNPAGGYILLAANWRAFPVETVYTISLLGESGKVAHLFDPEASWDVAGSSFKDTIEPMGTRAYAIPGPAQLPEPVEITVDLNALTRQADTFYTRDAVPDTVPGRRNIIRNSGFEETSIPGMPDYFWNFRTAPMRELGYRFDDTRGDPGVAIDTENPYEGKHSLRMTEAGLVFSVYQNIEKPTKYVFSFYARADTENARFGLAMQTGNRERAGFNLTTEWQRFHTVIELVPAERGAHVFYISARGGNVWVDAMQMELGTEPTEYTPE